MDNWNRPDTALISRPAALRSIGTVKIGHTSNLQGRLSTLRYATGCDEPEILAFRPGTVEDEQAIHRALNGHQHHGEEFYYLTRAVMAVVNEMRMALGLGPLAA